MKKRMSRENQKLIYWFIECYAYKLKGVDINWQTAGSLGGYSKDKGQGEYISLCRHHHTEKHNIGVESFERKYDIRGIKLNEDQVKELKKIYKGHFKAFKEEK